MVSNIKVTLRNKPWGLSQLCVLPLLSVTLEESLLTCEVEVSTFSGRCSSDGGWNLL